MINKIYLDSAGDISIHSTGKNPVLWLFLSDEGCPMAHVNTFFHDSTGPDTVQVTPEDLRLALRVLYQTKRESL